ncbi:MAG: NMD3-related protein [Thermoplasmatales archaeon]
MVCGNETTDGNYICEECRRPKSKNTGPVKVKIKKCPNCGRVMHVNWDDIDKLDVPKSVLEKVVGLSVEGITTSGDERNIRVSYSGRLIENDENVTGELIIQVSSVTCPTCARKLGNYYEATVQIRGRSGEEKKAIDYLSSLVEASKSEGVFITRVEQKKEGYDVLLSDKKFARAAAKKVIEKFGGTTKETSHLVGLKDGNELYRVTISIRIPTFKRGDVIQLENELFMVKLIKGETLVLLNLKSGSARNVKFRDLKGYSVFTAKEHIREARVLYRQGNTAYIMDPFDFKEKAIINDGKSDSIKVVKVGEELIGIRDSLL